MIVEKRLEPFNRAWGRSSRVGGVMTPPYGGSVTNYNLYSNNDTERAVRPQGIGIIMIASGNHTIMQ